MSDGSVALWAVRTSRDCHKAAAASCARALTDAANHTVLRRILTGSNSPGFTNQRPSLGAAIGGELVKLSRKAINCRLSSVVSSRGLISSSRFGFDTPPPT